ncbi:MAG: hypothetical protein EOP05_18825 [Proteobacteria bacterium]|nr:MAG: hypothetical protein EOP05_18825 [Pseudomonadota bacterium]
MKTDLNSIKTELKRLADVDYLKKELNRLAKEVKNFDLSQSLTPQAKARVDKLEKRFRALKSSLQDIQSKADATFEKFAKLVRGSKASSQSATKTSAKSAGKTSAKSARGSAKKAAPKDDMKMTSMKTAVPKTSAKKAPAKKRKNADV